MKESKAPPSSFTSPDTPSTSAVTNERSSSIGFEETAPTITKKGNTFSFADALRGGSSGTQPQPEALQPSSKEPETQPKGCKTEKQPRNTNKARKITPPAVALPKMDLKPVPKVSTLLVQEAVVSAPAGAPSQQEHNEQMTQTLQELQHREAAVSRREQRVVKKERDLKALLKKLDSAIDLTVKEREDRKTKVKKETDSPDLGQASSSTGTIRTTAVPSEELTKGDTTASGWSVPNLPDTATKELTESIQRLELTKTETHQELWFKPVGAYLSIMANAPEGYGMALPAHREVLESKCGWLRDQKLPSPPPPSQDEEKSAPAITSLTLSLDPTVAEACFFFAYTGGKYYPAQDVAPADISPGQRWFQDCIPDLREAFDLSSLRPCLSLYNGALVLQMPELCCFLLEQVEILATNVAEAACIQQSGGLWSDLWEVSWALESALKFIHGQTNLDHWRPMRMAFAGLYDAVALRAGPYLTFNYDPITAELFQRLHEDHVAYRQSQRSCLPITGSMVLPLEDMESLLAKDIASFWYGTHEFQSAYLSNRPSHDQRQCQDMRSSQSGSPSDQLSKDCACEVRIDVDDGDQEDED